MSLYAALLAPLAWRIPGHPARMLHGFARAERGSMLDLLVAANFTPSPARRAAYLIHALDESRHATMFAQRADELRRSRGQPAFGPPDADSEQLYERLGELGFVAFVHAGEARGRAEFERHVAICRARGDERTATVLEAIVTDERRHEQSSRALLLELAGTEPAARAALRRARLWEAWRLWRRAGRAAAHVVFFAAMCVLYVGIAPLAWLVRRQAQPRGWAGLPAPSNARIDGSTTHARESAKAGAGPAAVPARQSAR